MDSLKATFYEIFPRQPFNAALLPKQIGVGLATGVIDFTFTSLIQKVCELAGMEFKETMDEDDIPAHEVFDKDFYNQVIRYPILEEVFFRGFCQPIVAYIVKRYLIDEQQISQSPKSLLGRVSRALNIPASKVVASMVVGGLFGSIHYFNYEKGGVTVAIVISFGGAAYGIIKEKYGLRASMTAHIVHNFLCVWFDKYYPD